MNEKDFEPATSDDLSALRILLHRIQGISLVSSEVPYLHDSDPKDE
jgi:hypothetical protein